MITQLTVMVPLHELIFRRIVASDRTDSTRVSLPFGYFITQLATHAHVAVFPGDAWRNPQVTVNTTIIDSGRSHSRTEDVPVGPSQVNYESGNAFDSDHEALSPARAAHASSSFGDPMLQFLTTQFETMHTHFDAQLETHYTTMTQRFDACFETFKTEIRNDLTKFTRCFDLLPTYLFLVFSGLFCGFICTCFLLAFHDKKGENR